jgi:sporulation protein YlmC with PRC-barrel domain
VRTRMFMAVILALALAAFTAACAATEAEDEAEAAAPEEAPPLSGPAPELDLETLRAETPEGTVEAEPYWGETYVGAVTDDLYIAVSFSEEADEEGVREAKVYLCDGEGAEYLTGEVGDDTATFEGEVLDVELSLEDGAVSGAVIRDGEEPRPFTADEVTGDAGLYTADFTSNGEEYRPYWVVLPDGSQRGGSCWPCDPPRFVCCVNFPR